MKNLIKSVNDIKVGYVVELRDGTLLMCMEYGKDGLKCFAKENLALLDINKSYTGFNFNSNYMYDVMKVYGFSKHASSSANISTDFRDLLYKRDFRDLLYKREVPKRMTIRQIEKELGYEIELVSEDD